MQNTNTTSQEYPLPPMPKPDNIKPRGWGEYIFGFDRDARYEEALAAWQRQCEIISTVNREIHSSQHANDSESSNGSASGLNAEAQDEPQRNLADEIQGIIDKSVITLQAQNYILTGMFTNKWAFSATLQSDFTNILKSDNEDDVDNIVLRGLTWSKKTQEDRATSFINLKDKLDELNQLFSKYFKRNFNDVVEDAYSNASSKLTTVIRHHLGLNNDAKIGIESPIYQDIFVGELIKKLQCEERNDVIDATDTSAAKVMELRAIVTTLRTRLVEVIKYAKRFTNEEGNHNTTRNEVAIKRSVTTIIQRPAADDCRSTATRETTKTKGGSRIVILPQPYWQEVEQREKVWRDIKIVAAQQNTKLDEIECIKSHSLTVTTPMSTVPSNTTTPDTSKKISTTALHGTPFLMGEISPAMTSHQHIHTKSSEFDPAKAAEITGNENVSPTNSTTFSPKNSHLIEFGIA